MRRCAKCVLPETYPTIEFDEKGVCVFCNNNKKYKYSSLETEKELQRGIRSYLKRENEYDILVPLSGGVDSSVVLINIVEKMGLKALGFHFDHGFEYSDATDNVKRLCSNLNTDLIIRKQNNDFYLKLWKYINTSNIVGLSGCYICGNVLYLEAIEIAHRFEIPMIVNGYSKGQAAFLYRGGAKIDRFEKFFEIIMKDKKFFNEYMKKQKWLSHQKIFKSSSDLKHNYDEKILIIPFYQFKFYKTDKETLKEKCIKQFGWKPLETTYPKRTTNCEMIWLNVYYDLKRMGYSVYDEEYSTLIRSGEITREKALDDLEFNPPKDLLEKLSSKVGIKL